MSWPHVILLLLLVAWLAFKLGLATAELDALQRLEEERDWEEHVASLAPLHRAVITDEELEELVQALEESGLAQRRPNLRVVR